MFLWPSMNWIFLKIYQNILEFNLTFIDLFRCYSVEKMQILNFVPCSIILSSRSALYLLYLWVLTFYPQTTELLIFWKNIFCFEVWPHPCIHVYPILIPTMSLFPFPPHVSRVQYEWVLRHYVAVCYAYLLLCILFLINKFNSSHCSLHFKTPKVSIHTKYGSIYPVFL